MKGSIAANAVILLILLTNSIARDLGYQKHGAGDLRNRVVGARLATDGIDPYFYKWKTGDPYRYLDYSNNDSNIVSTVTTSPLFHQLFSPIANLPQRTIAYTWFILEYIALLVIIATGVLIVPLRAQKLIVLYIGVLFTYTHGWLLHLLEGQLYVFIATLLSLLVLAFTRYKRVPGFALLAGVLTVILIFVRPIAVVILIPFFFALAHYKRYLFYTFLFAVGYLAFVFASENQQLQWKRYLLAMSEQVKVHQDLPRSSVVIDSLPALATLEGIDLQEQKVASRLHPFPNYSENGNFFFVYSAIIHRKLPLQALYSTYLFTLVILVLLWKMKNRGAAPDIYKLLLFCLVLYLVTELFTPIHRHQYNSVQWLPLVLLSAANHKRLLTIPYLLVAAGLVLNITNTDLIPMRHTLGEYSILGGLLLVIYEGKSKRAVAQTGLAYMKGML